MKKIARIGLDLAKNVFQVHAVTTTGEVIVSKSLKRAKLLEFFAQCEPCLVGMEACGSAHHWARELTVLGHEVRLMAAQFVTPYRKSGKNDRNDAEAICEAVSRPTMRFVPVKTVEQQAILSVHRSRTLLIGERTALINHLRGLLGEFGIVLPQGAKKVRQEMPRVLEDAENGLPDIAREVFADNYTRLRQLDQRINEYDCRIAQIAKDNHLAQRIMQIEGVGPITATAVVASVGEAKTFANGRQFAAWLGLTPRQKSSGGRSRLGRISKRGDTYLRTLIIHGSRSAMLQTSKRDDAKSRWVESLKERRNQNVAAVALAAKNARIMWAMLSRDEPYRRAA
ncbi:IS110 family transposase [Thiohalophilus sp.]|uniref:IS110 family transposase n=1 Tax=Thiohalophilus sp. TaxID=3028392 RepID=UPI002ACDF468|nr:IS110 family transposase [Thiohalophilus sp.]MDZ7804558.1 IS110 family transposase [Thiohalophilus sp.]MDZ7804812.1 IS110 family transposase [Thiohalophilus sp.]